MHGDEFQNFNRVLNCVMQERATNAIGSIKRQAEVISLDFRPTLWERGILGEDKPDKLRSTVLYLLGINCALCSGDENYALRRPEGGVPHCKSHLNTIQ